MKLVSEKEKYALYMSHECESMMIVADDGEEIMDGTTQFDEIFESQFPEYIY